MKTYELSSVFVKRPRTWVLWLKRIGKGLLIAAIVLVVRQSWNHYQATKKLDETLAEMDRAEPGWRLEDIEAVREQIPEDENSARVVAAAGKLLPKDWPPPELDKLFGHLAPEEQLDPGGFARLKQELDQVRPALERARKLAVMPRGRHRLIYKRNPLDTLLPDQQEARRVGTLLGYDALRYDQIRDMKAALTSCRAELNAARSLGDEPFAISQLVRIAGVIVTCQSIERVLAQGEPPLDELTVMQNRLHDEESFPDLLTIGRGERGMLDALFDAIESGDVLLSQLAGGRPNWQDHIYGWFTREKFREAHPSMLELMSRWLTIAQLPMHEQAEAERELDLELRTRKEADPLSVLFIPALNKVAPASRRKHACIRCMTIALATERFRAEQGMWPDTIEELCPKYVPSALLDPFDGEPLRYRRLKDGVMVYSIGNDAIDNGGNLDREHPYQPGADIGYRLWDVAKRRQPPQPKPAEPPAPMPPTIMPDPNPG